MPLVSLVIPAYRERARLPGLLAAVVDEALLAPAPPTEILVVDDGSGEEEAERERASALESDARLSRAGAAHRVRFLPLRENRGKGAAVRAGWSSADPGASWLGFLDADGAVSAREAWRLVRMLDGAGDFDVLAATRVWMAGRSIERGTFRHVQGRVFASMAEHLFHLGFYDTQCGLKLFRAELLRPLLPSLREERWLLDVEVLALLRRRGARFREEPIDWRDRGGSRLVPGVDALRMAAGLWRIRRRLGPR